MPENIYIAAISCAANLLGKEETVMSNCKVIAITNQKGGIAKTTTAINLGVALAENGKRVLLIDADPQSNLTSEVKELTRDEAIIIMVESNLQRSVILPSEKAFAYKMRLEAMKRQAGRPPKENASPLATNFPKGRSDEELGDLVGESKDQIRRSDRRSAVCAFRSDGIQRCYTVACTVNQNEEIQSRGEII